MYDEDNDYYVTFTDGTVSEIIEASAKLMEGNYYEAGY